MHFFFRGFRAGFAAFLVTIAVENFVLDKKPDHGHEQPAAH